MFPSIPGARDGYIHAAHICKKAHGRGRAVRVMGSYAGEQHMICLLALQAVPEPLAGTSVKFS